MDIIGKMYHTVRVLVDVRTEVSTGGAKDNYVELMTIRAEIKPYTGSRTGVFAEILGNNTYDIITRFQSALWTNISMSMKFTDDDGNKHTLQSFERKEDRRKAYILFRVTRQKDG